MSENIKRYLLELAGTFILVLFSAGAVVVYHLPADTRPEVSGIALVRGLTLAVLLSSISWKSFGGFNPAFAIVFYIFRRLNGRNTLVFIALQIFGAVLAGMVIRSLFSQEILLESRLGTPHLKAFLDGSGECTAGSLLSGMAVEMVLTAFVAFAVFAAFFDPRVPRLGGILPGLAMVVAVILGFHLTGGSCNPAIWYGPMVWEYTLPGWASFKPTPLMDHVVYWAAPIAGAFLGGLAYSLLVLPHEGKKGSKP